MSSEPTDLSRSQLDAILVYLPLFEQHFIFSEGTMATMFQNGLITAVRRRLCRLRDEPPTWARD